MVVVQDFFNDNMNWCREKFDTGAGSLWLDSDQEEYDAIVDQRAAPNAIRQKKLRTGQKMSDAIFKEDDPQLPETLVQFIEMLQGQLPQFMLAAPPAIFGAAMEDQKTASGYAQARSQAMGQLGVIWAKIQRMFARIRYQSALCAANDPNQTGEVTIPGQQEGQNVTIDMEKLRKGDFGCYPDEDSSFPESTAQKRATLQGMITLAETSPAIQQLLDNPDNIEEMKRLNGFEELVLLPAEARNKQLWEIEQLLKQAPIPPDPQAAEELLVQHAAQSIQAHVAGQPEPPAPNPESLMQPTIMPDELDFHLWEFQKCQEWLSSAQRRTEDAKGNQAGVMNVKLHALAHQKFLAAMAAQQAAMAAPPAPAPHKPGAPPPKPAQQGPASPAPQAPAAPSAPMM